MTYTGCLCVGGTTTHMHLWWNRLAVASDQAASTNDEQVEFSGPLSKVATIGTQLLVLYREASLIQG